MANPTPDEYAAGHVKQNHDDKSVAVRTTIPDSQNAKDWAVMTVDRGGHYASWDEISDWQDMQPIENP